MQYEIFFLRRIIFLISLFIFPTISHAQEKDLGIAIDSTLIEQPQAIAVVNIIQNIESVNEEIKSTERILVLDNRIVQIDSLFPEYLEYVKSEKLRSEKFVKSNPNRQKIDNLILKWKADLNHLSAWESSINQSVERNARLEEIALFSEQTWGLTYENAIAKEAPQELLISVKNTWDNLKTTTNKIVDQNNQLLILESKINKQKRIIKEVIAGLIELKNSDIYALFNLRHAPLWNSSFEIPTGYKSSDEQMESIKASLTKISKEVISPQGGIYIYLFLVILFVLLIKFLNRTFTKYPFNEQDGDLQNAKDIILNHPISCTIFYALVIAKFFFNETPTLFRDILILAGLITSLTLIKPYMYKRFKKILYFIILFFILDSIKTYFWFPSSQYRIYLLLESTLILLITYQFTKPYLETRKMKIGKFGLLLIRCTPIIYFLTIISMASNILGYSNLADITIKIILQSATTIIIFYGMMLVTDGLVIGLIQQHFSVKESYNQTKKLLLEKNSLKIIRVIAVVFWGLYFLQMIYLLRPLTIWVSDYLSQPHKLGTTSFTIGSILTFLLILVFSYLATRLISYLFDDDSSLKYLKLPKGIPAVISLVLRYLIFAFGIVLALSSLNIDLSKFNLMTGALGLGIGFGLQTVISNFVSGIILVFERPILKGDTVEVNNLIGTVNRIGVRSSSIRTFDGAEVVVPNNNLISNDLINWTLSDNIKRVEIVVGAKYGSDPNEILKVLVEVANNHKDVLKYPKAIALFSEFGDSSLNFQLRFWVPFEIGLDVKSDVFVAVYNKFEELDIEIPFPQQNIYIKEFPKKNDFKK